MRCPGASVEITRAGNASAPDAAAAAELAPGSGHSIHLAAFDGVVYYTVEQDGYRVVATLAPGGTVSPWA
ncbi:MAG: hypothetical protein EOR46_04275 [Mesorhizobium sp.]|nr:MAG: hypothetical protein EOR46_04275 [Mesorhizobium sp.]